MVEGQQALVLGVFLFVLGAAIGSFLNVVIYRLPRAESIAYPPSHCFSCGARLTVVDLFPILSYVLLRGRCRHCGRGFSPRYALVEAACGVLAVACGTIFGLTLYAAAMFVVCLCLIAVFFIDLDYMIIPDEFVVIIAVIGFVADASRLVATQGRDAITFSEWLGPTAYNVYLPRSVVGFFLGAGLLLFLGWIFEKAMGKPSMGGGDVKLAGAMGTLLGPGYLFLSYFLIAVIAGAVIGLAVMALRLRGRRDYIPFGPMLAMSGIAMLLWGDVIGPWVIGRFTA
ncbi:MAG: prepilin peptidase [Armatimonadia bacterium]